MIEAQKQKVSALEQTLKAEKIKHDEEIRQDPPLHGIPCVWMLLAISHFVHIILKKMIHFVPIPSILSKLISLFEDKKYETIEKELLFLLQQYDQKKSQQKSISNCLSFDSNKKCVVYHSRKGSGFKPRNMLCNASNSENRLCDPLIESSIGRVRIFRCGHSFHAECIACFEDSCVCPICHEKSMEQEPDNVVKIQQEFDSVSKFSLLRSKMDRIAQSHRSNWDALWKKLTAPTPKAMEMQSMTKLKQIQQDMDSVALTVKLTSPFPMYPTEVSKRFKRPALHLANVGNEVIKDAVNENHEDFLLKTVEDLLS